MALYYSVHRAGHIETLNGRVAGTDYADMTLEEVVAESGRRDDDAIFHHAGQAWNHVLYWEQFAGGPAEPEGAFADAVAGEFGDLAGVKSAIADAAGDVFGTGWGWLVDDGGTLTVEGLEDAGNPVPRGRTAIQGIDVGEHTYHLDYENRRKEHVTAVLDGLVNWRAVGERMAG